MTAKKTASPTTKARTKEALFSSDASKVAVASAPPDAGDTGAFEIEHGVRKSWATSIIIYPYELMEVTDSFLVKCTSGEMEDIKRQVSGANQKAQKEFFPKRFSYRCTAEGIRVWREKDASPAPIDEQ